MTSNTFRAFRMRWSEHYGWAIKSAQTLTHGDYVQKQPQLHNRRSIPPSDGPKYEHFSYLITPKMLVDSVPFKAQLFSLISVKKDLAFILDQLKDL